MPWGLRRFHESGQSHFVTFGCYHRRPSLGRAQANAIVAALERVGRSFRLCVFGYVVMPEHLLIGESQRETVAHALKSLRQGITGTSYSVTSNLSWNTNGSLQQFQFTDGSPSPLGQTCTYQADDLSRIASVNCGNSTWTQNFSYDPFGNLKKAVPVGGTGITYAAGYSTVTNQVSSGISPTPTYDANGNQKTSTATTFTWNAHLLRPPACLAGAR